MKHLLTITLLYCHIGLHAQLSGVVTYEEIMKITFEVPAEFKDMISNESKSKKVLIFNETESIYRNAPEETNVASEIEAQQGGMRMRFMGMRNNNETYKNLSDGTIIERQDFMGREFRITGQEPIAWKMTSEQKKIGDYLCMKATYMRDTIPVAAWFTPQIPVSNGPGSIGQLPGLVLEVEVNNGSMVISAVDIDLRPLREEEAIVMPDKGKEITREEFNKLRDEKLKEMREMGGGHFIFQRGN